LRQRCYDLYGKASREFGQIAAVESALCQLTCNSLVLDLDTLLYDFRPQAIDIFGGRISTFRSSTAACMSASIHQRGTGLLHTPLQEKPCIAARDRGLMNLYLRSGIPAAFTMWNRSLEIE
jgi:hypothetical protein